MANARFTTMTQISSLIRAQRIADGGKFMLERAVAEVADVEPSAKGFVAEKTVPAQPLVDEYKTVDFSQTLKDLKVNKEKRGTITAMLDKMSKD
jgi:hypothetical protein